MTFYRKCLLMSLLKTVVRVKIRNQHNISDLLPVGSLVTPGIEADKFKETNRRKRTEAKGKAEKFYRGGMFEGVSNYVIQDRNFQAVEASSCTQILSIPTNLAVFKTNMDSQDKNTSGQIERTGRFSNVSNAFKLRSHRPS